MQKKKKLKYLDLYLDFQIEKILKSKKKKK